MKTQPAYTIREQAGRYQVFDRNQHYRRSFATRAAATEYIATQAAEHRRQPATAPAVTLNR